MLYRLVVVLFVLSSHENHARHNSSRALQTHISVFETLASIALGYLGLCRFAANSIHSPFKIMKLITHGILAMLAASATSALGVEPVANSRNKAVRLEWFRDLGFGMFIHWSHDSQLGSVISHSMVGADDDYLDRFVNELPKTFNPRKFHPSDWASLAKLAGMKYVMFTTKHHSGFCMYDTKTTNFSIMHTPFKRDISAEVFDAFRAEGISAGVYFSPDDFWWLRENQITIQRQIEAVHPRNNPGLMKHNLAQLRELMTGYGKIDMVFFDGETDGLTDLAWDLQPETVVTRGAIRTPEQHIPGTPIDEPWESCLTMGTQWQYKPTNEVYMSGGDMWVHPCQRSPWVITRSPGRCWMKCRTRKRCWQ